MSKLGNFALDILRGGLPEALDSGKAAGTATGDNRPEQIAPSPKVEDRDTSRPPPPVTILDRMTPTNWAIAGVGIIVVGVVLFASFRALGRR